MWTFDKMGQKEYYLSMNKKMLKGTKGWALIPIDGYPPHLITPYKYQFVKGNVNMFEFKMPAIFTSQRKAEKWRKFLWNADNYKIMRVKILLEK